MQKPFCALPFRLSLNEAPPDLLQHGKMNAPLTHDPSVWDKASRKTNLMYRYIPPSFLHRTGLVWLQPRLGADRSAPTTLIQEAVVHVRLASCTLPTLVR